MSAKAAGEARNNQVIRLEQLGVFANLQASSDIEPPAMSAAADHLDEARQEAKYYLIFLYPVPERPLSREVVDLHAMHLAELDDSGKLVMAGPVVERSGRLIVLRTESAAEAMAIAEEDPLVRGAYQTYELGTWLISNRQNDYHPEMQSGSRK